MGLHYTLIFIPENDPNPFEEGRPGAGLMIAPEYDGLGPFWFSPAHDDELERTPSALALPIGSGLWYYDEREDWADLQTAAWDRRVREAREALAPTCVERLLRTKA